MKIVSLIKMETSLGAQYGNSVQITENKFSGMTLYRWAGITGDVSIFNNRLIVQIIGEITQARTKYNSHTPAIICAVINIFHHIIHTVIHS